VRFAASTFISGRETALKKEKDPMNRNLISLVTAGAFYAALSTYLLVPTKVAAQSPSQGPPAASANARHVLVDNLTTALTNIIQPAVSAENAALASDPNFHAVITPVAIPSFPYMGQTGSFDQPNQFFADVPYSFIYRVTNISVKVNGSFVPYPDTAIIGQDIDLRAICSGWFTGRGALTYSVVTGQAGYVGNTNFPNPEVGALLQVIIPNFVNTVVNAKVASYPAGSQAVESGAGCRSLGTFPPVVIFVANQGQSGSQPSDSPAIIFDPPALVPPIVTNMNSVTVTVTRIRRLELHAFNGQPAYAAVETPTLDFFAGFTHLHIQLPAMSEGQSFVPTSDNVATTLVPLESGTLVLLGVMTYEDLTHEDSAFVTFSRNLDFGAGTQTLDTPKQVLRLTMIGKPGTTSGPAYEITVEITAPPVQIGTV
jgi:hypothetical protein